MSRQNLVIVGIIALAAAMGVTLSHLSVWVFGQFGVDDYPVISRELPLSTLVGFGLALVGAIFCLVHKPTRALANEIGDELAKVSWPTREETSNATVVVLATVGICALYLGLFDAVWLWLTNTVLGIDQTPVGQ